ncbi:mg2+ transporter zinc transport protein [Colletotrichum scovillei]|uniref:Mg2+ transporter zinc transport protein n=1 Tax=Colletotrichum scovillei TaxID=1209932 RepID=A0A9P7R3T4_9PEZI|nr:mg2+ transporter zinc transport protein [Colletotrichum scovillei]KAG7066826.1 mg2+ transporter zinc transport protein [Colletotrichum scovillei]
MKANGASLHHRGGHFRLVKGALSTQLSTHDTHALIIPFLIATTSSPSEFSRYLVPFTFSCLPKGVSTMASEQLNELSDRIAEAARKGMARKSFFSFGDEGLTASVGATGRLLRITQHFPGLKTGICVDDEKTEEPYYVFWRLSQFLERSLDGNSGGIGPRIDSLCPGGESKQNIINDRWPTFTITTPGDTSNKLHVSYVAFQGTVYQKFEIIDKNEEQSSRPKTKEFPSNILDALSMDSGVLIRDLNFVDSNNLFNGDSPKAPDTEVQAYTTVDGQAENHVRREHNSHGKHFILHLQVLDQDNSLKFHKPDQKKSSYFIKKKNNKSEHAVSEVVLAYTLRQGSAASDLKPLPDWSKFLEARRFLQHHPMVRLTEDENLDFFLRRNLEYVLSVCSIPVHDADPDGIPAYALTCGDVDSHRVSTAASFYAFQLLLLGLDRFTILHSESEKLPACMCDCDERPSSAPPLLYVCMMKRRIEHVCRGHMKWVFQKAAKPWKPFCPNYWTNGDEIEGWESNAWLPRRSLVDAPFQFIKAADFYRRLKEDMPDKLMEQAKAVYKKWLCHLGEVEKSGKYAFPSYKASGDGKRTKTFYLTDHALIWQAARSAESMKLHVTTKNDSELNEKIGRYSADRLRENIIRRFTTENSLLKKRMIATKRNPYQTRFLFRSKDVALFRAMEENLFEKADIRWSNTLDSQKHHEGNDDNDWSDPRRFTLAIAMARHGKAINLRTRKELIKQALSVLLSSSSSNGLFTGTLDERQNPSIYDDETDRDDYWTVVFEVPYILWKDYCTQHSKNPDDSMRSTSNSIDRRLELVCQSIEEISKHLGDPIGHPEGPTGTRYRYGYWMKHNLPFNNVIDDNNIVELQDEWLYNEPAFFVNATNVEAATVPACLADAVLMINVPEYKSLTKKRNLPTFPIMYFRPGLELWFKIIVSDQREVEAAEKRFWAFASKQAKQNSSCINTFGPNEEVEQAEMTEFFDRHKSSSNFFTEETTAALNIWTTEFHVTFYSGVQEKGLWLGKESEKAAMGFRFEGDFFNKYWTCRFVVADPRLPDKEDTTRDLIRFLQQDNIDDGQTLKEVKTGVWEERRVLELMLFGRIMRKMATSAGHILELAGKIVKEKTEKLEQRLEKFRNSRNPNREQQSPTPDIDYDSFHLTSNEFRKFQAHLQTIHGDFEKARPIRNHWLNREKDRQAEQPQWTFSDESRYRPILNKLLVENHRAIQDLDRNLREISLLAESITKEREYVSSYLEIMANDQSRRNDYDVKLFTNITAVFLPLGFATGMFSMSGTPDAQTVVGMFGLFVGVFILGLLVMIVAKAHARYGSSRQIWEELIRRGQHKIDRAYLLGTSMILILIVAKFYAREVIRRGRQKSNGASLWHGREGSAEGNPTEETNAERKEDVADEVSRRRFCGLKIRRKEESGASARHREGLVEEGRGGIDASTVNETPAAGSAQTFNG